MSDQGISVLVVLAGLWGTAILVMLADIASSLHTIAKRTATPSQSEAHTESVEEGN